MPTIAETYAGYPDGAPAGHTHYGLGASSVSEGKLLTTGLGNGQRGGATLDATSVAGSRRALARFNLVNVGVAAGFGIPCGGLALNYAESPFAGFRVTCRYHRAALASNTAMRIGVAGSRVGDSALVSEVSFGTGSVFLTSAHVINLEARYTPGVGAANGTLEYRAWRDGTATPAFGSVAVNSYYAALVGPAGIMDAASDGLGSNVQYQSMEIEGPWLYLRSTTSTCAALSSSATATWYRVFLRAAASTAQAMSSTASRALAAVRTAASAVASLTSTATASWWRPWEPCGPPTTTNWESCEDRPDTEWDACAGPVASKWEPSDLRPETEWDPPVARPVTSWEP